VLPPLPPLALAEAVGTWDDEGGCAGGAAAAAVSSAPVACA